MYSTSLPLYCELVVASEEGAEGGVDSGGCRVSPPRQNNAPRMLHGAFR